MDCRLNYNFLQLEFAGLYRDFKKIEEEEDLHEICNKVSKLLEDIIDSVYLKNKLYLDKKNNFLKNIATLSELNIVSEEVEYIITNYLEEISYIKENSYSIESDIGKLKDRLNNIYELFVWLVLNYGEEDYTLFYDKLNISEKDIFDKYLYQIEEAGFEDEINEVLSEVAKEEEEDEDEEEDDEEGIETIYILSDSDEVDLDDDENIKDEEDDDLKDIDEYYLDEGTEKDYVKARKMFEKSAKEGNANAQGYLAIFYEKGLGGSKDISKAIYWYKKSALKGNAFSQYSLGYIYFSGKYVEKNMEYAFQWYKKAAENNFPAAQYALSYLYKNGIGCDENIFKAYYWLEESADNDFEDAYYILGQSYLEGSYVEVDYKKAFLYLGKGANNEDENCLESLGDMYYWGFYVKKDTKKAFEFYKKSIDKGNKKLYYKVARLYEENENHDKAMVYYLIAHNSGDVKATQRIGTMYYKGEGVKQDISTAIKYMLLAAEEKSAYALYFLGVHYLSLSKEKAIKYLKEAYEEGSAGAAEVLVSELLVDILNEKNVDCEKLIEYINMAMENDKKDAIYYYGLIHAYGIGVKKSIEDAFRYIKEAAEKGSEKAMVKLGDWYKHGVFVQENPKEAIAWYKEAAKKSNVDAILNMIEIYEKGIGVTKDYEKAFEGAKILKEASAVQGNIKLAYYYIKGIGVNKNEAKAKLFIDEAMILDEKKTSNFLGLLAEEELYGLKKEDAIEYYKKAIKLGYGKAYINLQYYLYKNDQNIDAYEKYNKCFSEKAVFGDMGKCIYLKAVKLLKIGREKDDNYIIEEAIKELKRSVNQGFYEAVKDIVAYYEQAEKTQYNLMNLYKYKQKMIYYNIK